MKKNRKGDYDKLAIFILLALIFVTLGFFYLLKEFTEKVIEISNLL